MSVRREPLPALTALRFFAALAIFVFHAEMFLRGTGSLPFTLPSAHLATGVQFFFVLSGFILTYNYLDEFRYPTRRGVWNFYVARWARIYPVHILTALAALPFTLRAIRAGAGIDPISLAVTHLLLIQAFVPVTAPEVNALNGVSWTLSVEWCFYLALPLLIPALTRGHIVQRAAVVLLVLAPWGLAVASVFGALELPVWMHPYRFPLVRAVDFVLGVLLGVCWHRRSRAGAPVSVRWATFTELATLAGLAVWSWACVRAADGKSWVTAVSWIGVYLPPFAVCLWVFARGGGRVSRVLASRPMEYLGEISFAFYMIHIPLFSVLLVYGWKFGFHKWSWPVQWLAACAATLLLSAACYHLYEIPLRDWLRRRLAIRKPQVEAPTTVPFPAPAETPAKAA
jgi:peptidoglycan/LPS O-acetylase OafA/YrhL